MFESFGSVVYLYAKKHWDAKLPKDLRFKKNDAKKAASEFLNDRKISKDGIFIRLVGQSGVGKTTQLLPAAEAFFEGKKMNAVLVAAKNFVKFHPHYEEILKKYGEQEIRKRTDDFATMVMFYVLIKLAKMGADFILDLSFVSTKMEWMFVNMIKKYERKIFLMMTVPEWKNLELLKLRSWRHGEKLEREFLEATKKGLDFYEGKDERIIMWGFDGEMPIYDGGFEGVSEVFEKEMKRKTLQNVKMQELIEKKRQYLKNMI